MFFDNTPIHLAITPQDDHDPLVVEGQDEATPGLRIELVAVLNILL
jgi:hypothetical protein